MGMTSIGIHHRPRRLERPGGRFFFLDCGAHRVSQVEGRLDPGKDAPREAAA